MLKEILAFLKTGIVLVFGYVFYAILIFVLTILLGTPIYLGVRYIDTVIYTLFQ